MVKKAVGLNKFLGMRFVDFGRFEGFLQELFGFAAGFVQANGQIDNFKRIRALLDKDFLIHPLPSTRRMVLSGMFFGR